jgi:hypothetical protein
LVSLVAVVSFAVIGCDSAAVNSTAAESSGPYSEDGPFIKEDPYQLIREARWISQPGDGVPGDMSLDQEVAVLDTSSPASLNIGITGSLCYPHVFITVLEGPPSVELLLQTGDSVVAGDEQCPELLTAHEFELVLSHDIDLGHLTLTVTEQPNG